MRTQFRGCNLTHLPFATATVQRQAIVSQCSKHPLCPFSSGFIVRPTIFINIPDSQSARTTFSSLTCTLSPKDVMLPLPTGEALQLDQDTAETTGVGGKMWRGAGAMCRWLRTHPDAVQGATVLELGAGTGIGGLYAAGLVRRALLEFTRP